MNDHHRVFDAVAGEYDDARRRLIPGYDAFYGAAVEGLELLGRPPERVLDLGAGTGALSAAVAAAHPHARLTLLDAAPAMLDRARAALGDGAEYVLGDLTDPLPAGPWDAIVTALAVHHLTDAAKRDVYARARAALTADGVLVNAEQVAGPTEAWTARYRARHERRARALGACEHDWHRAVERMELDMLAPVDAQLEWLREAGFAEADCVYKDHGFAVLVARR